MFQDFTAAFYLIAGKILSREEVMLFSKA